MTGAYKSHQPKPSALAAKAGAHPERRPAKVITRAQLDQSAARGAKKVAETGGPAGPEPTRYGDWEIKGRCIDF